MDSIGIEKQQQTDSMEIEIMFLAGVSGSMVLIFSREFSIGWAAPSHAQFFNLVVALTMVTGS